MEQPKIVNLVLAQLSTDNLRAQENLEYALNNRAVEAGERTKNVIAALREMAITEVMIGKFNTIVNNAFPQN